MGGVWLIQRSGDAHQGAGGRLATNRVQHQPELLLVLVAGHPAVGRKPVP